MSEEVPRASSVPESSAAGTAPAGAASVSNPDQAGSAEVPSGPGEPAASSAPPGPSTLRKAWSTVQQHPLGVIATLGAATAFVEVELAVGILGGIGATAFLATNGGAENRQRAVAQCRRMLDGARAWVKRTKTAEPMSTEAPTAPGAPPAAAA